MKFDINGPLARQALAALHTARPKQFQVVELFLQHKKQVEIAATLGITQPTVSRRLAAAQKSLRQLVVQISSNAS